MLNELKAIADEMREMGTGEELLHPFISPSPKLFKAPKFIAYIKKDSIVGSVELVDAELWNTYKYVFPGGANQYPIIKMIELWGKEKIDQETFFQNPVPEIVEKKVNSIMGRLIRGGIAEKSKMTLTSILSRTKQTESVFLLLERILEIEDQEKFLREIIEAAFSLLPIDSDDKKALLKKDALKCMYIAFDIEEYHDLGINPVNSTTTIKAISDALKKVDEDIILDSSNGDKIDIFGESYSESVSAKIPQLNFKGVRFYPYSRNVNTPCNKSYNVIGGEACPLSPISREHIVSKIQQLIHPDNKGTYWDIHKNKNGTNTATIVFAPVEKTDMTKFQHLIVQFSKEVIEKVNDEFTEGKNSRQIIDDLRGCEAYKINKNAHIMFLNIPGNGPSVLTFSIIIGVKELFDAAGKWVKGWENHENNEYTGIYVKKGERKALAYSVNIDSMRRIINKRWNRRGNNEEIKYDVINTENIIKMFLGDSKETERIAHILGSQHVFLLIDIVNRIHNKELYDLNGVYNPRKDIFKLPVVFGEVLYQLGIKKEDYKNSLSYMVGQMFANVSKVQKNVLATKKHSRLVGTKYIHLALVEPQHAINLLLTHAQTYLSRAKIKRTVEYRSTGSSSCFHYYSFQEAIKIILNNQIPEYWSDVDKMLIALGYFQNK